MITDFDNLLPVSFGQDDKFPIQATPFASQDVCLEKVLQEVQKGKAVQEMPGLITLNSVATTIFTRWTSSTSFTTPFPWNLS